MELAEMIGLRPVTCAGLLVSLTRRCPLGCAHCSTASTPAGEHLNSKSLLRFIESFTPRERPELIVLTGGEPLLRPRLVAEAAERARARGTRSAVLTGAFFARGGRLPAAIGRVLAAVDHCSVSLDAYHEARLPRRDVFGLLRTLLDRGAAVSLHLTGAGPADPYLEDVTSDVARTFGARVPMLVSELQPLGRAAAWHTAAPMADSGAGPIEPCALAAWPVIAFDGTVTACCNQDVVDGPGRPGHLRLGHLDTDSWPEVSRRSAGSPLLRLLRSAGPRYLGRAGAGYCRACHRLDAAEVAERFAFAAGPAGELLDREAGRIQAERGPAGFVRRHGCARYADLVTP